MKLLFLLIALFAFVFSSIYDYDYGCNIKGKKRCCWIKNNSCCKTKEGPNCQKEITMCCKTKQWSMEDAEYVYIITGGKD